LFKKAEATVFEKKEEKKPVDSFKYLVFGGFCILGGCVLLASGQPWQAYSALFALGAISALKS
jgi:hypothetical protein